MSEEKLSNVDQQRVDNCEYYLKTKQVMKNAEVYKELAVGEVYYIKYKDYNDKETYVMTGWGADTPAKYMVFHKDDGFVFVKRIIASGNLGKEVICLTTTYDVDTHWLEADPDYVNSILLENEEDYDPLAASKAMTAKKNRARRRNKKMEVKFETAQEAYDYIKKLRKGDKLYDAATAYGSGVMEWVVDKVSMRKTDQTPQTGWYGNKNPTPGKTWEDQSHNEAGFPQYISVKLKATSAAPRSRRWENVTKDIIFTNFRKDSYHVYYESKPFTVDDV